MNFDSKTNRWYAMPMVGNMTQAQAQAEADKLNRQRAKAFGK